MDQPLVSVIMPAYNAEKYISDAIQSVIDQTYQNLELIIVDDGSTDATATIIKSFANSNHQIKYHYQRNSKQGKARNLGIKLSKGSYIAFLDADDVWHPKKTEIQISYLILHPEIDLIFSKGYYLLNDSKSEFNVAIKIWDNNDIDIFIGSNQIPILSVLVRKKSLTSVNGFKENLAIQNVEDYDLWIRLLLNNSLFSSISDRLFYYRIHENQVTNDENNVILPVIKMLDSNYSTYDLRKFAKNIIKRLKWYLFTTDTFHEAFYTIIKILRTKNRCYAIIARLIFSLTNSNLRNKLLFKLFSWV